MKNPAKAEPGATHARSDHSGMRQLAPDAIVESTIEATLECIPFPCGLRRLKGDDVVHVRDNARSARFFGRTAAEMHGRTGRQLGLSPRRINAQVASLKLASGERATVGLRARHATISGVRDVVYHSTPLSFDPSLFICVTEDVTDLKSLENEAVHAERLAALGTLMAALAHDMAGPATVSMVSLEGCLGAFDALESGGALEPLRRDLLAAKESLAYVLGILRSVRSYSQSNEEPSLVPCDLNEVVDSALQLSRGELSARARVKFNPGTVPPVRGTPVRLGQVILNLVSNAARAASLRHEPDAAQVVIQTMTTADGRAKLEVVDNGSGLAAAGLRLFEPFATRHPNDGGTGLGLFISKRIIESFGGTIELANRDGDPKAGAIATVLLVPLRTSG